MLFNSTTTASDQTIEKCVICQEALKQNVANLSGCAHKFHKDCIDSWKNITNQCPVCRKRFDHIAFGHHKYRVETKEQKHDDPLSDDYIADLANAPCQICDSTDLADTALLCDGCDGCFHTHCLGLLEVPEGDWYCDTCQHLQRGSRRNNGRNNRYAMDQMISRNEHNPIWTETQDADYVPSDDEDEEDEDDEDIDLYCEQKEERNNRNATRNTRRKRKRFEIEDDDDDDYEEEELFNNRKRRKTMTQSGDTWYCKVCTFKNEWKDIKCEVCETKRSIDRGDKKANELSVNDYFGDSNDKKKKQKKEKYSRNNPYRRRCNDNRGKSNMANIIGDDILSRFNLNESEDWLSPATMLNTQNKKIRKNRDPPDDIEDEDDDQLLLKPKPKMKYRERYQRLDIRSS